MNKIYFLEKLPKYFLTEPKEDDLIIALTAQVSFELDELGFKYVNPEDISYPEEVYIPFVLRWLKSQKIDSIFFQNAADTMKAVIYWVFFLEELDWDDEWIWIGHDPPKFPIFKRIFDNYLKNEKSNS